ncbi:MAG TPA: ABC transporter permease [Blastocatellia bacterium]|nr:ABC transporter permease [Blastocatellia bacterium]
MDSLIVANIRQRPLRTAISVIGVALGVILVVLFVGLARGMMRDSTDRQSNVDAEVRFFPGGDLSLSANPLRLPSRYADAIMKGVQPTAEDPDLKPKPPIAGVAVATPVGEWVQSGVGAIGFELIDGIDYPGFVKATQLHIVEGRPLGDGRGGSDNEAIVDGYYAEHNFDINGQPVHAGSHIKTLGHEFTVVGIYAPSMLARVKIPLRTMQQLFGGAENCSFLMIKCERPELAEQVKAEIQQTYPGNHVLLTSEIPSLYGQSFRAVEIFLNVVIGLALVISTLVILLGMYTTIIERTREIGILKSLGASKSFIILAIEKEAALISALGIAFGFLIAIAGKFIIQKNTRLMIDLPPQWLLIAALIGLAGGVIGALYPAVRAANLDPVEAISYE